MSAEHETFIKTPKQLIIAIVLSFLVPILLIALLVKYVGQTDRTGAGANAMSEQSIADRIRPVGNYQLGAAGGAAKVHSGEEVYSAQCAACHAAGVAGAPKFGDTQAWAPRIANGIGPLLQSALKGKGAMVGQAGGKFSDLEIARAVAHMANNAGAEFADPTAESIKAAPKAKAPAADSKPVAAKAEPVSAKKKLATKSPAPVKAAAAKPNNTTAGVTAAPSKAAAAAAVAARVANLTETTSTAGVSDQAVPTTADTLVFSEANDVQQASGQGIPDRLSIFFPTGGSTVTTSDTDALRAMISATMETKNWTRIGLSGYTDGTGDAQTNAKLALERMTQVRNLLVDMGIAPAKIVLVKPEQVQAAKGESDNARRVDVYAAQ